MSGDVGEHIISTIDGTSVKARFHPIIFRDRHTKKIIARGIKFESPTKMVGADELKGRQNCDNCIYQRSYVQEDNVELPEGTKFEDTDDDNDVILENGIKKTVKMFYWCDKGQIKLAPCNAPCELWNNETDKINEDGTPNLVAYHTTDYGNAERLIALYGDNIRYCYEYDKWYFWDDKRWKQDSGERLMINAKNTIRELFYQADLLNKKEREDIIKFSLDSEAAPRINAMIKLAESERTIERELLDSDQFKINILNKTLDLKTFVPKDHNKFDYMSKIAKVSYKELAECPKWIDFLNLIFKNDSEIISGLQRFLGYCLTGDIGENVFFILHGAGNNGKSTFLNTIMYIMGEYATSIQSDTIMMKRNPDEKKTDLARLVGIRFIACSEGSEGVRLNEALIKQITGTDQIICRFLYGNEFAYIPEFKIWYATNHRPDIKTTDEGTWRRIIYIPFDINIPEVLKEKNLPRITNYDQELIKEAPGILNWMLEGLKEYYRRGSLDVPLKLLNKAKEYRQDMDVVQAWLDEECDLSDKNAETLNADLVSTFNSWAIANGEYKLTPKVFSDRLKEKGYEKYKGTGGARGKKGIKIKQSAIERHAKSLLSGDQWHLSGDKVAMKGDRHSDKKDSTFAETYSEDNTHSGDSGDNSLKSTSYAEIKKDSAQSPRTPHRHFTPTFELAIEIKEQIKEMSEKLYEGKGVPETSLIMLLINLRYDEEKIHKEIKKLLEIGEVFYPKEGIIQVS